MQTRVISIKVPRIPCWKLTGQVQHLCKYLKCGAKGASYLSNEDRDVWKHIESNSQGGTALPLGTFLWTLL